MNLWISVLSGRRCEMLLLFVKTKSPLVSNAIPPGSLIAGLMFGSQFLLVVQPPLHTIPIRPPAESSRNTAPVLLVGSLASARAWTGSEVVDIVPQLLAPPPGGCCQTTPADEVSLAV